MSESTVIRPTIRTMITFTHPYAGHVNVAKALKAAGLDYEVGPNPNEMHVLVHRNIPVDQAESKAAEAVASALRAMSVAVEIEGSTPR